MEHMEKALKHFETILQEQFKRLETMNKPKKDFASMEKVTIGVCGGDGIGPIITDQAARILAHLLKDEIAAGKIVIKNIERYFAFDIICQGLRGLDIVHEIVYGKFSSHIESQCIWPQFLSIGRVSQ